MHTLTRGLRIIDKKRAHAYSNGYFVSNFILMLNPDNLRRSFWIFSRVFQANVNLSSSGFFPANIINTISFIINSPKGMLIQKNSDGNINKKSFLLDSQKRLKFANLLCTSNA